MSIIENVIQLFSVQFIQTVFTPLASLVSVTLIEINTDSLYCGVVTDWDAGMTTSGV